MTSTDPADLDRAVNAVEMFPPHVLREYALLDAAVQFVSERLLADGPDLKPAYTIVGGPVPDERSLHLPGYPGGYDIIGNHVNAQFQLDALGEALLLFAAASRHDHLSAEHYKAIVAAVAAIEARWREPDAGIWELDNRRWAHSRLICAAGLRAMAAADASTADAAVWSGLADTIVADAASDCVQFSEEYDVTQRQMRGNLPQAFVHALMLEAAVRLS